MKKLYLILLLLLSVPFSGMAQITIAPTMVFIDQQNRFGSFLVLNNSDRPQEISVEFPFGYPTTKDNGDIQMVYDDTTTAREFGISNIVRGFPQNFVLQPGQRQVVRLTIRSKDFTDGMYWTRIKTTSSAQQPPVGEQTDEEITAQITYKFEQVTTLFYKHGGTETGIEIQNFETEQTEDNIEFTVDASRIGNSPFLGSITLTLEDKEGNIAAEKMTSTSIYFDYRHIFKIPKTDLEDGSYEAQITFETRRPDIPQEDIVQMEPVSRSISYTKE